MVTSTTDSPLRKPATYVTRIRALELDAIAATGRRAWEVVAEWRKDSETLHKLEQA